MNEIRVINFVPGLGSGGVAMLMREWYTRKDESVVFDIATIGEGMIYDELVLQGCKIFSFEPITKVGMIKYIKNAVRIIKKGDYNVVHSHVGMVSVFVFIAAIIARRKVRILHAHGTKYNKDDGRIVSTLLAMMLKFFSVLLATDYLACSKGAAKYLFGNRIAGRKAIIINNGIDLERFTYQRKAPEGTKTIGYIARFEAGKNHLFLFQVIKVLIDRGRNVSLLLIGDGEAGYLKKNVAEIGIEHFVQFLPAQKNIEEYYHKMDVFAFPSLNEGLGIVAIEAQACGVPTIVSLGVPEEVMVSTLVKRVELDVDLWVNEIEKMLDYPSSRDVHDDIIRAGFDINESTRKLMSVYLGATGL